MIFRALALLAMTGLAGCGVGAVSEVAPMEEVQRRAYVHPGPSSLTLYTVINNRSGSGAHTALMISGSQRVLWDPAGSFRHPWAPERNDVLYGFNPNIQAVYEDYHARETFRIVRQSVTVSPEVAEKALRLAQEQGAAGQATCSITTTGILAQLQGFEGFPRSYFPVATMKAFAARTGDAGVTITDEDADDNHGVTFKVTRPPAPQG
ncbi:hypothetical protein [Oceaniovalibus sp. ACAM 378]|uniref:hypothetical protein n=1 Tax=Oceaniovalibus sp. ACAM 378 TaxID=2599923 RepID=UPI0011DB5285|nr:hypothetical protein [Oceaniovalibus sp. ACAM 378]TYB87121.1 hypothetical protein FQ320_14920 [Oceaniovalibus sp. ACAM 378]